MATMTKMKANSKFAWIAKQDKNGWAIGLDMSGVKKPYRKTAFWLTGLRVPTKDDVKRILKGVVEFIPLKGNE